MILFSKDSSFGNLIVTMTPTQRIQLFVIVLILCVIHNVISFYYISTELVEGCLVPDGSMTGYTPEQARQWYSTIGQQGRRAYSQVLFPLDLVIMVSYVTCLSSQIYNTLPKFLAYLPILTVMADLTETTVHAYYCFVWQENDDVANETILSAASAGTQIKFLSLNTALLLFFVGMMKSYWKPANETAAAKTD